MATAAFKAKTDSSYNKYSNKNIKFVIKIRKWGLILVNPQGPVAKPTFSKQNSNQESADNPC